MAGELGKGGEKLQKDRYERKEEKLPSFITHSAIVAVQHWSLPSHKSVLSNFFPSPSGLLEKVGGRLKGTAEREVPGPLCMSNSPNPASPVVPKRIRKTTTNTRHMVRLGNGKVGVYKKWNIKNAWNEPLLDALYRFLNIK